MPLAQITTRSFYPRLENIVWLEANKHIDASSIARRTGAKESFVKIQLQKNMLSDEMHSHWTPIEIEILSRFYPTYPASLLSSAIGRRGKYNLSKQAKRLGLSGRSRSMRRENDDDAAVRFWPEWRCYLLSHIVDWIDSPSRDMALSLTWAPAQHIWKGECDSCDLACNEGGILPCERMTVADLID